MAARRIAIAEARTRRGKSATGMSHRSLHAGARWKKMRNNTITQDWKKRKTEAEPIEASGSISRGKDTFLTKAALLTIALVAVVTPVEKRFHTSKPEKRSITKSGMPFLSTTANTRV